MLLFEYVAFPKVPKEIEDEILKVVNESVTTRNDSVKIYTDPSILEAIKMPEPNWKEELGIPLTDVPSDTCDFYFLEASEIIKDWVRENIPAKVKGVNVQVITNGLNVVPHVDEVRWRAYNYLLSTGGDNVETCFYKPKQEYNNLKVTAQTYFPWEKLDLVEKTAIEERQWHSLAVNNIHSVENITGKRIALTLSVVNG